MKRSIFVLLACVFSFGAALATPRSHLPVIHAPAHPPVRPPVMVRPPTLPNQIILEQRRARDMAERRREEQLLLTPREADVIDDPKNWEDVANLTFIELYALLDPQEFQVNGLDSETVNAAKAFVIADLEGEGRSHGQVLDMIRMVDGTFGWIETKVRNATNDYTADVAREFKQIYAANCCGEAEFTRALGDARTAVSNQFVADMTASLDHTSRSTGMTFNVHVNVTYDENTGRDGSSQAVQAVRALGGERGPDTQIASVTPTSVAPVPTPETPVVEAPAPPVQTADTKPLVTYTPTQRETVAPGPQVGTENTKPLVTYTPTIRSTVTPTQPATSSPDLLTAIPAYTPPDAHSSPTTTVPIRTTSVPTSRDRFSGPSNIIAPPPRGPSFVSSIAAVVGPAIRSGLVTAANWMDDHELLGREYNISERERHNRSQFHGIGNGAFEGRLGFNMTPTKVIKGGFVSGSNVGGGLVL